jgi:hypothetical protein
VPKGVKKWEYLYTGDVSYKKQTYLKVDGEFMVPREALDLLGSRGWELVSVNIENGWSYYWFKREVVGAK